MGVPVPVHGAFSQLARHCVTFVNATLSAQDGDELSMRQAVQSVSPAQAVSCAQQLPCMQVWHSGRGSVKSGHSKELPEAPATPDEPVLPEAPAVPDDPLPPLPPLPDVLPDEPDEPVNPPEPPQTALLAQGVLHMPPH